MVNAGSIVLADIICTIVYVLLTIPPCKPRGTRTRKTVYGIMASRIVETRPGQTLVYFKLAVFPEITTVTLAFVTRLKVDTKAILCTICSFTVINAFFAATAGKSV